MIKVFTSPTQKKGEQGEELALRFLVKQGYRCKERNFGTAYGEIDLIVEKLGKLYFCEVKLSLCRNVEKTAGEYDPFANITGSKRQKMIKTAKIYLQSSGVSYETPWELTGIGVFMERGGKRAKIQMISLL